MEYYVDLELVSRVLGRLYVEHWICFTETQEREELDDAIFHGRIALRLCPNRISGFYEMLLHCLANSLSKRYEQCEKIEDLGEAIELHRAALQLCPDSQPNRLMSLNNLATFLWTRCERHGQIADLDEAIELYRAALQLHPDSHPDHAIPLNNLANSLGTRFQRHGQTADLDEAIRLHRSALQLCPDGHPDRSSSLCNLARFLLTRFQQHGQTVDFDEALELSHVALQLHPDGHPERPSSLNNLANSLWTRFQHHGQTADLDEAIELHRAALQLRPDGHPSRSATLNNLANSLQTRFKQYGQTADLDEAIELYRAALKLHPDSRPNRSASLNNLAISLWNRCHQHGQTADLNEAIELHRSALQLCPDGHPDRNAYLNNLASSLQSRFEHNGQTMDLDEAIELNRAALQLHSDGHSNRSTFLNCLASSLEKRFKQHGQTADIDEAIELNHAALQLRPDGHPDRNACLINLASSLQTRFEQYGQTADLDEAIRLHRASLQLLPNGQPARTVLLGNMATSLLSRFEKFGLTDDFDECINSLESAAEHDCSSLVIRLDIAILWTKVARVHDHHTTSRAYNVAMLLLQRVLVITPTLYAQHDFLTVELKYPGLTLDAVAHAVKENRLEEAIEIFEQGRGLLWSQMRGFRTPLERLADTNGDLAERFRNVSQQLESLATSSSALQYNSSTTGSVLSALGINGERILSEERLKLKRKLSYEQQELIKEIQQIPGFENFLKATPFETLRRVASEGPVILVNLSRHRSDVLIILPREDLPVVCLPLDGDFVKDSLTLCGELLETRVNLKVFSPQYNEVLQRVMGMLWNRVVSKVVNKLKELGITEGSRIWWCPTSFLSILPFHAVGPFKDADGGVKYLLDDYVSSYTPTLGALVDARLRQNTSNPKMLIVGDTKTLKSTKAEILAVRNISRSYVSSYAIHINKGALRNTVITAICRIS